MTTITSHPKIYHVRAGEGGWEVRDDATCRTLGRFDQREDAIALARDAVEGDGLAQLIVHHPDGRIASQWPSDAALALARLDVIDAGEFAGEAPEGDRRDAPSGESGASDAGDRIGADAVSSSTPPAAWSAAGPPSPSRSAAIRDAGAGCHRRR